MTRVAITGHRGLPEDTERLVASALRDEVARHRAADLVGLSCLADGADALFARAVLDHGGELIAVVPAAEYRAGLPEDHHQTYDALLRRASRVVELDHVASDSHAHMDASEHMLGEAEHLVAVWDGRAARGYGGTADVVATARQRGVPVTVLWPEGASRD